MRFFLRHQPENMTLVVLSRNLPQLGIANLRVRDQLLEIGSQQLAFTHQEAKQFFDCRLTSLSKPTTVAGCATMSPGGPPRYNSSPSPPARITPPPNTPPAASPGLTPAICRIIWWMKCWITLTPARATFC
ncbi:transcriptional regulator MalT [Klebsiella pneumoniae]|nr:transcriptional regulator MalT [Klebsiella pneumoniae]